MGRDIRFRAFDKFNEGFHYSRGYNNLAAFFAEVQKCEDGGNLIKLDQFTGLQDKNGKDIYSGDIVRYARELCLPEDYHSGEPNPSDGCYKRLGHVTITTSSGVTLNGVQTFTPEDEDLGKQSRRYNENPGRWSCFAKVVGDIHTTPELLKE